MRAVLRIDPPLVREVFEHLLGEASIEVVGSAPDPMELLMVVRKSRPDVVFLMAGDSEKEPGICSHLLSEHPRIKIVIVSTDNYSIADVGTRTLHCRDLTIDSIRGSLLTLLAE
jgi:DNA-binding NarL/FixJ family response regulator